MFRIKNLGEVEAALDRWLVELEGLTAQVTVGLSVVLFDALLENSAQYSGDYAANWKYRVGSIDTSFTPNALGRQELLPEKGARPAGWSRPEHRKIMGDDEAIQYARAQAAGKASSYQFGDVIYLSNSAVHDEPYAFLIEGNKIKFRAGNQGETYKRAADMLAAKYSVIGAGNLQELLRERLA